MFRSVQFLLLKCETIPNCLTMEQPTTVQSKRNFVYCQHYKKLIVEDFSLNEKRENIHYGKCAVIGYCTFDRGVYFLGNVRITSFNRNLQLADNVHKILLLNNLSEAAPPIDRFVEVFGESVLYDTTLDFTDDVTSIPHTTSLDLFQTRSVHEAENGPIDEAYDPIINHSYRPAIKVHAIVPIEDAHEIVNCNLKLKQIADKM